MTGIRDFAPPPLVSHNCHNDQLVSQRLNAIIITLLRNYPTTGMFGIRDAAILIGLMLQTPVNSLPRHSALWSLYVFGSPHGTQHLIELSSIIWYTISPLKSISILFNSCFKYKSLVKYSIFSLWNVPIVRRNMQYSKEMSEHWGIKFERTPRTPAIATNEQLKSAIIFTCYRLLSLRRTALLTSTPPPLGIFVACLRILAARGPSQNGESYTSFLQRWCQTSPENQRGERCLCYRQQEECRLLQINSQSLILQEQYYTSLELHSTMLVLSTEPTSLSISNVNVWIYIRISKWLYMACRSAD